MSTKRASARSKRHHLMPTAQSTGEIERTRQEAVAMKSKIRSLELEVETLKQRLESLRKAKSTTIIKREREEVLIQPPNLGRRFSALDTSSNSLTASKQSLASNSHSEMEGKSLMLQEELQQKEAKLKESRDEINRLSSHKVKYEEKIDQLQIEHQGIVKELKNKLQECQLELKKESEKQPAKKEINVHVKCVSLEEKEDLLKEMEKLRIDNKELAKQLSDIIDVNVQLRESNQLLQEKCEVLLEELSVKEAKWTEREEKLQAEIRRQWGERYHEWITKAEKKMEELQKVNQLLQTLLRKEAPT
ncbi:PREDICTED: golgin subfamily A member 6C-like [Amphimedon queenslandica]|uniref:Uncharacterized protein n=1 Tax=Amphimedon queenslandica TaxID=400682 RepID=A0A1X7UKP1_AMPQE|nr:PREDICTED: golgin subfamily A member 6C-like [Amphimedon queenslandica]|eukprot:XP_011404772.1 PREDICTED: golgin subfamily A member 6C-like [Amphimedon queenslandica]